MIQIYIKLIVSWQAVSQSVSVGPVSGLLNIPAWWWSWYNGIGSSFSFFLSYLGWGWVVLIVGTFESFPHPCIGFKDWFFDSYEASSICVVLEIGTNGLVISLAPYHALSYISLVVSCLSLVSTTLVWVLATYRRFCIPSSPYHMLV
jgi:hypothetical protein